MYRERLVCKNRTVYCPYSYVERKKICLVYKVRYKSKLFSIFKVLDNLDLLYLTRYDKSTCQRNFRVQIPVIGIRII